MSKLIWSSRCYHLTFWPLPGNIRKYQEISGRAATQNRNIKDYAMTLEKYMYDTRRIGLALWLSILTLQSVNFSQSLNFPSWFCTKDPSTVWIIIRKPAESRYLKQRAMILFAWRLGNVCMYRVPTHPYVQVAPICRVTLPTLMKLLCIYICNCSIIVSMSLSHRIWFSLKLLSLTGRLLL